MTADGELLEGRKGMDKKKRKANGMYRRGCFLAAILLVLVVFLNTSCGKNNGGPERPDEKLQTGNDGLELEFMDELLSEEVDEDSAFYATVELSNLGAYDIVEGLLLPSMEKDLMTVDSWELSGDSKEIDLDTVSFGLKGKSLVLADGEKQVIRAKIKTRRIDDKRNKVPTSIIMAACYEYATRLSETVCIDTDPENIRSSEKACEAKDYSSGTGQGAPVAVTEIKQKIIPADIPGKVKPVFEITVENKDKGIILDKDSYKEICRGKSGGKDSYNQVTLKDFRFSNYGMDEVECNHNPLKESKDKFYTRCTLKEEHALDRSRSAFQTNLMVTLGYGYKQTIAEDVDIINNDPDRTR